MKISPPTRFDSRKFARLAQRTSTPLRNQPRDLDDFLESPAAHAVGAGIMGAVPLVGAFSNLAVTGLMVSGEVIDRNVPLGAALGLITAITGLANAAAVTHRSEIGLGVLAACLGASAATAATAVYIEEKAHEN